MNWLRYIGILALLLFLQVFVLDNLHGLGLVHPFVYLWAFMMLPIELPRWMQMSLPRKNRPSFRSRPYPAS